MIYSLPTMQDFEIVVASGSHGGYTSAASSSERFQRHVDETTNKNETQAPMEDWKHSKHEKAIIYTLALLNLIVSLDATIIVTSLTVTLCFTFKPGIS